MPVTRYFAGFILFFIAAGAASAQTFPVTIVLAQHGVPANDCPKDIMDRYEALIGKVHYAQQGTDAEKAEFHELEQKIIFQTRTPINDPFWASSYYISDELKKRTDYPVFVGFNEYCAPTLPDALLKAAAASSDKVIVVTPMMTPGGSHPEKDLPKAIEEAKAQNPNSEIEFIYAWPKTDEEIARALNRGIDVVAAQVRKFTKPGDTGPVVLIQHGATVGDYRSKKLQALINTCNDPETEACKNEEKTYLDLARQNKYWFYSEKMSALLSEKLGRQVLLGFNEYAYPTSDQALKKAAKGDATNVTVVTSMLTNGGEHGDLDIPAAIDRSGNVRNRNNAPVTFTYAWPYDFSVVADYLQAIVDEYLNK